MNASKPLIGVTTYRQPGQTGVWDGEFAMIPGDYLDGVERAGGIAVLIPPQELDRDGARRILAGLDGLLLCGGRDVDPARYDQEPGPTRTAQTIDAIAPKTRCSRWPSRQGSRLSESAGELKC